MNTPPAVEIWKSETGIQDFETDPGELSSSEIPGIRAVWAAQRNQLQGSSQLVNFTEKMSREWAIETGVIENLYDIERGVTQTLIERGFQAKFLSHGSTNKPRDFVIRMLNDQKDALDGVFDFVKNKRDLSVSYIKELHAALLRSQETTEGVGPGGNITNVPLIKGDWKTQPNFPVRDGVQYTYCPREHVASEMERLIDIHNKHINAGVQSEVQAAWLHHRFTQIHPFQDGNGRAARAIASLVMIKDGLFPLVITRDNRDTYIDALEKADSGDLAPLVNMFAKLQAAQFNKASNISEEVLVEEDVDAALNGLLKAADKIGQERLAEIRGVFGLAEVILDDLEGRFQSIKPTLEQALDQASIEKSKDVFVRRSREGETDYYFRNQIIEIAKNHIGYFVDTSEYRAWISLNMHWNRSAQIVFAVHGIGKPFNGSLICAPFMEFRDQDDDEPRVSLAPLTEEGFVFFYNEDEKRMMKRFRVWRERVLKVAVKELKQNL
ncbi:MAG: Fic family protein [Rhodospirillales bacterium]